MCASTLKVRTFASELFGDNKVNYKGNENKKMSAKEAYDYLNSNSNKIGKENSLGYFKDEKLHGAKLSLDRRQGEMIKSINTLQRSNWTIKVNGKDTNILDAVANSFDCEADLYIQEKVKKVIEENQQGGDYCTRLFSEESLEKLRESGIVASTVEGQNGSLVYSFSLVDKDGKVLEDESGHKASIIITDALIPDGRIEGAEFYLSSILDEMGYDCISQADFIDANVGCDQYEEFIKKMEKAFAYDIKEKSYTNTEAWNDYGYKISKTTIQDIYGYNIQIGESLTKCMENKWGKPGNDIDEKSEYAELLYLSSLHATLTQEERNRMQKLKGKLGDSLNDTEEEIEKKADEVYNARLEFALKDLKKLVNENGNYTKDDLRRIADDWGVEVKALEEQISKILTVIPNLTQ